MRMNARFQLDVMHTSAYNIKCQEGKPMKTSELTKRLREAGCYQTPEFLTSF